MKIVALKLLLENIFCEIFQKIKIKNLFIVSCPKLVCCPKPDVEPLGVKEFLENKKIIVCRFYI